MALICAREIDFPVPCSLKSRRNCIKSLPRNSLGPSCFTLPNLFRCSITRSKILPIQSDTFFISLSTPCMSNLARVGKKSETLGFPNITVSYMAAARNSAPRLVPSSPSIVPPQNILVIILITVENSISPTLIAVPTLPYISLIHFFTSFLLRV